MILGRVAMLMMAAAAPWTACARSVAVGNAADLAEAVAAARPGDDIVLNDGQYLLTRKLEAGASGTARAPVVVRAAHRFGARIRSAGLIAFEVTGSYWSFRGLEFRGVCLDDTQCEHAFHVVGAAAGFRLRGSRLIDFNAAVKVNADNAHAMPSDGVIEDNEFFDTRPRHTDNPVAPINIDNAMRWVVRHNFIHDFQKDGAGEGSYGAFVKGGSQAPLIERNVVMCARDHAPRGQMVGLSFGAHGMDPALCPPHWDARITCDPEVQDGIMRNNFVFNCTDDGMYLNRARASKILFNTLVQTGGIDVRYAGSSAEIRGNLLNGAIRARDGGKISANDNVSGAHTPRQLADWFKAGGSARLVSLPGPDPLVPTDFCSRPRGARMDVGAVQASTGRCTLWP